jgi:DNA replication protein DnaC
MSCYICNTYAWIIKYTYSGCDDYDIDDQLIEQFVTLYQNNDTRTLTGLLVLLDAYSSARTNIIDCAIKHHMLCICSACGRNKHEEKEKENDEEVEDEGEEDDEPVKKHANNETSWVYLITKYMSIDDSTQTMLDKMCAMRKEIANINDMIGMAELKDTFLRLTKTLAKIDRSKFAGYTNIVISGPPGHGKTEIAKLLGKAFLKSGFLTKDVFISATRAELIGKYCGHTPVATTKMFDKAKGGVIFIDEVYSLGNKSKSDAFTAECIDTINLLTGERKDTLCIVAGYEHEIQERFFAYNDGLTRRFPWRFNISAYDEQNLVDIFYKLLKDHDIKPENNDVFTITDIEKEHFTNAVGDIANLITNCTTCHHDNCFLREDNGILTRKDVVDGLREFTKHRKRTIKTSEDIPPPPNMYT